MVADEPAADEPTGTDRVVLASLLASDPARGSTGPPLSNATLRAIRTHLGMDVAFIAEFTDRERVFRYVDAASDDAPVQAGGSGPLEQSYCLQVAEGRLPELIHDAGALPAEFRRSSDIAVGAHLSVPIRLSDGRVYGTLCCFSTAPDYSLNERDLAVMRVFADLTAMQIDGDLERDRRRVEAVARLRAVASGDGLSMVFQPIVDIDSGRAIGFEALARVGPAPHRPSELWFTEAAAVGLGVELELSAVRLALGELAALPDDTYLAVNASPSTVASGLLEAELADAPAGRVVIEVTEHQAIEAYDRLEDALAELRRRGVRIAVDDAGAGYASFRHVLRLRPDLIKLDMTLTRDIDRDPARRALAGALISFARDTGSVIVAEGVETAAELHTLRLLGVTAAQGHHLGRPGPLAALSRS